MPFINCAASREAVDCHSSMSPPGCDEERARPQPERRGIHTASLVRVFFVILLHQVKGFYLYRVDGERNQNSFLSQSSVERIGRKAWQQQQEVLTEWETRNLRTLPPSRGVRVPRPTFGMRWRAYPVAHQQTRPGGMVHTFFRT